MKTLKYYQTSNGKQPFKEWLMGLKDVVGMAQINKRIERLMLGQRGDSEPVGEGVFELRIHYGPGYRLYYAEQGSELVILLYGGSKGSQQRDIDRAITYWKDYLEQYHDKSRH
ncbi:MAG: addiction module protein [Gammaproteobacteria bacterium CG_4_10_14_0_8_um_filter_38_16]|nr:MAG: addiction module protein [Gammaproteobacteria bacterium CG_4_10_14_0_8_um_filter_38_16]PJA04285.1 MAG: addiction module protein [Gammaproteobacteria bacterium CG_4_10_14_0_2_um_filter_38_22]PJB11568.1 MAG: addiction module protein [Gammaproteobacteria bacterium CG_4_9_14_3_um_filter_38_9]